MSTGPATDKLDPKAEEHIFIGVDEKANAYYLASLPHFKISVSAHVIFVEDDFPCKRGQSHVTCSRSRESVTSSSGSDPLELRRSARGWIPSTTQLENLADAHPSPPSDDEEKHEETSSYCFFEKCANTIT